MRVTTKILAQDAITNLRRKMSDLQRSQEQATTLQRVRRPSDDPVAAERLVGLRAEGFRLDRFGRNVERAHAIANQTDSSLSRVVELLSRAKEVAVAGLNGTRGADELAVLGHEATALREQAVSEANTRLGDVFVFSGYRLDSRPFDDTGLAYSGDGGHLELDVGPQTRLEINRTGEEVFVAGGVFTALNNLEASLAGADREGLNAALDEVDAALRHVIGQQGAYGATAAHVEEARADLQTLGVDVAERTAEVGEVDFTEAVSRYTLDAQALESMLKISSRTLSLSLVDLLG